MGNELMMSSAYHPQTNWQPERVKRCLVIYLQCWTRPFPGKWSQYMSKCNGWCGCLRCHLRRQSKAATSIPGCIVLGTSQTSQGGDVSIHTGKRSTKEIGLKLQQACPNKIIQSNMYHVGQDWAKWEWTCRCLSPYKDLDLRHKKSSSGSRLWR
jgi:hypothetical protein